MRYFSLILLAATSIARAESVLAPGAVVEKLADGFSFTEGPIADADGNIYFTDQPNDRIHVWSVEGKLTTFLEPAGRSNGLYIDSKGKLWACADEKNQLWLIDVATKKHEVLVEGHEGKLLNGPNDIWVHPKGGAYFTDPLYQRPYWKHREPEAQLPRNLYYRNDKGILTVADGDLTQPNGIVGSPDGKTLYVADPGAKKTYAYTINEDGSLTDKRLFCEQGSDGMTLDNQGNLYLTGKGVQVYDKTGKKIEQIDIPENWTANICFGGKDGDLLFITASKGIYGVKTKVKGASFP
jgi:gluconolactonase